MCHAMGPHGRPMTPEVYQSLPAPEQCFWNEFDAKAREEIASAGGSASMSDYKLKPSRELQAMYERAVTEFSGADYCHVGQLREIFNF